MKLFLISSKYNYKEKFLKAIENGDKKYIESLFKRGKIIQINDD